MPAVNTATSGNHIVNFTPTLIGRHDAMFDIASLCFDGVSGLRLAVAGLEDVQVFCSVPCAHALRTQLIRTMLCSDIFLFLWQELKTLQWIQQSQLVASIEASLLLQIFL